MRFGQEHYVKRMLKIIARTLAQKVWIILKFIHPFAFANVRVFLSAKRILHLRIASFKKTPLR